MTCLFLKGGSIWGGPAMLCPHLMMPEYSESFKLNSDSLILYDALLMRLLLLLEERLSE
jgi:hypothetical protein